MSSAKPIVLVTAANGDQGRAAAHQFLRYGYRVRALVTDPGRSVARELAAAGAEIVTGDLADPDDVRRAVTGTGVVFAVPVGAGGEESKADRARVLVDAARRAGVDHFVQTTVADAADHIGFRAPGIDYDLDAYAVARLEIEKLVRGAGFRHWTILQPVAFMENLTLGKAAYLYPWLAEGRIDSVLEPSTRVQFVACHDIAVYAVAAVEDPGRFSGRTVALAAESLTADEVAAALTEVTGTTVTHTTLTAEEALAAGMQPGVAISHAWYNAGGYHAPLADELEATWGLRPLGFRAWARANRHALPLQGDRA